MSWGNVTPIELDGQISAAKLLIYPGDREQYFTFCTSEAFSRLSEYMDLRASQGEIITKNSPLLRDRWQSSPKGSPKGRIETPTRLASGGVKRILENALWKYGLRTDKMKRHEFSIHSLRKYFKTKTEQAMRPINVETLMGHSTGVSDSYYRPTERELLEDYLKAAPLLMISEVEQIRRESQLSRQELEERVDHLSGLVSRLLAAKGGQILAQDPIRTPDT